MNMNRLSLFGVGAAAVCFLYSMLQLYEVRTDWLAVTIGLGLMSIFLYLSLAFAYLRTLEEKFDQLTNILADTFRKLSAIEQQNYERFHYGPPPSNIGFSFSTNTSWVAKDPLDSMTVEQLEVERKKAEKAEDYEKAAQIQKRIDNKKGRS
jgi:hypothetical protein